MMERLDPEANSGESVSGHNDQFRLPFLLDVRPPSEFYYDAAKSKLITLKLGDGTQVTFNMPGDHLGTSHNEEKGTLGQQGRLLCLAGWVDMESRVTVGKFICLCRSTNMPLRSDVLVPSSHTCSEGALLRTCPAMMLHT